MNSDINNNTIATLIKSNPEFEEVIQHLIKNFNKSTSVFIHELRNPLTIMKSMIQYIEMQHPETKDYKYWDQLQCLAMDMENIMSDISTLNICNCIKKQECNFLSLIEEVVNNFRPQANSQQKDLKLIISEENKSYYFLYSCDSPKIKQVLSNLIKNAMEATSPGDYIHIILDYLPDDDNSGSQLCIKVANNGIPIPEKEIKTIFNPFITYKQGGTGIGLAVAEKIVNLHYGSISVTSSEEETCFTILLPR